MYLNHQARIRMTATLLPSVDVLTHVAEPLKFMVEELRAGRAPANVMKRTGKKPT
jgi:hypothetical protein